MFDVASNMCKAWASSSLRRQSYRPGTCCFDIKTPFARAFLTPGGPPSFVAPGGVVPREDQLMGVEESGLQTSSRAERLAGPLRLRKNEEWLPANEK